MDGQTEGRKNRESKKEEKYEWRKEGEGEAGGVKGIRRAGHSRPS